MDSRDEASKLYANDLVNAAMARFLDKQELQIPCGSLRPDVDFTVLEIKQVTSFETQRVARNGMWVLPWNGRRTVCICGDLS